MTDADPTRDLFRVETPESVAFAYELAGLGSRGLALMLDTLLIIVVAIGEGALLALAGWAVYASSAALFDRVGLWLLGAWLVLVFATYWAYFIASEALRNGRTWGKRIMRIRVVRDDGSRLGVGDSVTRNLLRTADMLPGSYAVGMLCILFTARNKRLGDMAAGTVVVRDAGEDELVFEGGGVEPRILLAREFLDRRASLTAPARTQVGIEVLRAFGEAPEPGWDEPTTAGRIADLSGWRELRGLAAGRIATPGPPPPPPDVTPNDPDSAGPFSDAERDGV
jgi:uncharacterized RDD family membrane protein YckC